MRWGGIKENPAECGFAPVGKGVHGSEQECETVGMISWEIMQFTGWKEGLGLDWGVKGQ